jgi:hypothetical protein
MRVMDERVQLQEQYDIVLQQKKEFEGWVEEVLKDKNEAKERVRKSLKEKDEAETISKKTQAVVQKLYKAIQKVPIVVEYTMEEQVLNIVKFIKGFRAQIEDFQLRSMSITSSKVREGKEKMVTIAVANIKNIEGDFTKNFEESVYIWIELVEDTNMKAIEAKLREA